MPSPSHPRDDSAAVARATRTSHARGPLSLGWAAKAVLVGLVDALGVYGVLAAAAVESWGIVSFLVVALVAVNLVYFLPTRRLVPMRYLLPGLLFLFVYQIFVVGYTGFTAFTNWGDGHNSTKEDAVTAILAQNERRVADSASLPLTVLRDGDEFAFAVVDADGTALVGTAEDPLEARDDVTVSGDRVTEVPGFDVVTTQELLANQSAVFDLRVPFSDDPNDGSLRTQNGSTGLVYRSAFVYDEDTGVLTGLEGETFTADASRGNFVSDLTGKKIEPGWKVHVGFSNFTDVVTHEGLRGPFVTVFIWTFVFAIVSVGLTFALGLLLAISLNHPRMRGQRVYRSLLILPYAFPAFLSAIIWSGMFNETFGFINKVLLGGASIDWLGDPWLAKLVVIFVNLWLGFPYMFLVTTGALQSIPGDTIEAAKMDGATSRRIFRSITMPLLLVSTAPLLISSFAFNFNNFNTIYLLTGGGPDIDGASVDVGHTDILISFVYRIAFEGINRQYGLASAISILIFLIVASISAATFRKTKALEDLN